MAKNVPTRTGGESMRNVGAIILGGGQGSRLYPLTKERAKPAVPLCGRYRLVDIPLSNCIHSGINRIVVLTQFNSHSLNRHITKTYNFDAFSRGFVEVLSAEQTKGEGSDWFQGTADAVRKQLIHIRDMGVRHYIVLSGDQLYRMDYSALMDTHLRKGADITVAALPVGRKDAQGFGVMKVRQNGRIRDFVEKPSASNALDGLVTPKKVFDELGLDSEGKPYLASMGVYAFNAGVLEDLLLSNPGWDDFGKEIIPNSLGSHKVFAHTFAGFWKDIGTVRSYFDVSMAMTSKNPPFEFHDQAHPVYTHNRSLPGVKVSQATVKDAILCAGSRIDRATITSSIIGIRSIIRPRATVNRCVVLGAQYFEDEGRSGSEVPLGIGPNTKISNAIIDHNARIGKGVVIAGSKKLKDYDGDGFAIRDGIVVVLKNATIPNGATIG